VFCGFGVCNEVSPEERRSGVDGGDRRYAFDPPLSGSRLGGRDSVSGTSSGNGADELLEAEIVSIALITGESTGAGRCSWG
jgi:hypothetical protein